MDPVETHLARVLAAIRPVEPVRLGLEAAEGTVLAADAGAVTPLPSFDNSSMDGYAVHTADIAAATADAPVILPVTDQVPAGDTRAVTGRVTGASVVAAATSAACTAYPSMDELSKDGRGVTAAASAASTLPSAASRPSWAGSTGRIAASTRARWASTGSMSVTAGRPGTSAATAGTRRPRPAVPARTG